MVTLDQIGVESICDVTVLDDVCESSHRRREDTYKPGRNLPLQSATCHHAGETPPFLPFASLLERLVPQWCFFHI